MFRSGIVSKRILLPKKRINIRLLLALTMLNGAENVQQTTNNGALLLSRTIHLDLELCAEKKVPRYSSSTREKKKQTRSVSPTVSSSPRTGKMRKRKTFHTYLVAENTGPARQKALVRSVDAAHCRNGWKGVKVISCTVHQLLKMRIFISRVSHLHRSISYC